MHTALIVAACIAGAVVGAAIGTVLFLLDRFEEQIHGW